jgi:hypothetical protein
LIEALKGYIDYKFLINVEITKEEIMIYQNKNFAKALDDLKKLVEKTRVELDSMNFKTNRLSQSINYYGFYVGNDKITAWFGYGLKWWLDSQKVVTPLFLQVRDLFEPNPPFDENFRSKLVELEFLNIGEEGWIKPFNVDLFNQKTGLSTEIQKDIDSLTKLTFSN